MQSTMIPLFFHLIWWIIEQTGAQAERAQAERAQAERAQAEQAQAQQAQAEQAQAEQAQAEQAQAEQAQAEQAQAEQAQAERAQAEQAQAEQALVALTKWISAVVFWEIFCVLLHLLINLKKHPSLPQSLRRHAMNWSDLSDYPASDH